MSPNVVSGAVSTIADTGRDEAWLRDWLREQPARLGLGELRAIDGEAGEGPQGGRVTAFLAIDDERLYSIDVRLGELEAAAAFEVLQGWAASRGQEPDKEHVAVLVTERLAERYRGTLTALAEHLPLLVVGLSVWRGESEVLVVPHVSLASGTLDLSHAPAVAAAASLATVSSDAGLVSTQRAEVDPAADGHESEGDGVAEGADLPAASPGDEDTALVSTQVDADATDGRDDDADDEDDEDEESLARLGTRADTGVVDPWRLSSREGDSSPVGNVYSAVGDR